MLEFTGVGRRFEYIGEKNGVKVYDDYAHHPTEIKATLNAAKSIKKIGSFQYFSHIPTAEQSHYLKISTLVLMIPT